LNRHFEVYHCGTSDLNRFTIDRACELTSLGHRLYYRKYGKNRIERVLLARWDTIPVEENHLLSIPHLKAVTGILANAARKVSELKVPFFKKQLEKTRDLAERLNRKLGQVQEMLDLFKPFIYDNRQIFKTKNLPSHTVKEPEFQFRLQNFQWRDYWLNIH